MACPKPLHIILDSIAKLVNHPTCMCCFLVRMIAVFCVPVALVACAIGIFIGRAWP